MAAKFIRELISESKLDEALDSSIDFTTGITEFSNTFISLRSRLKEIQKNQLNGTIEAEEFTIEHNKIIIALLTALSEMEDVYKDYFGIKKKFETSQQGFKQRIQYKFEGRFNQIEELANGYSSILYKAKDMNTLRTVVIKAVKSYDFAIDSDISQEIKTLMKLKHRNLMSLYYAFTEDYPICTVLEYVIGKDLVKIVKSSGKRTFSETKDILLKILDALRYLHQRGIYVHLLDPDNILIDIEGEPVFLPPFRILKPNSMNRTIAQMKRDMIYLSTSQIDAIELKGDVKSNLYSLGALGYFLLTGKDLFSSDSLTGLLLERKQYFTNSTLRKEKLKDLERPDIPDSFLKIMSRLWSENHDWNAEDLVGLLESCEGDENHIHRVAKESYERCYLQTEDFLGTFYKTYFEKSPTAKTVLGLMDDNQDAINSLSSNLHFAINLIIESTPDNPFLINFIEISNYKDLSKEDLELFFITLNESVAACDKLWDTETAEAWKSVIETNIDIISSRYLNIVTPVGS